MPAVFVHGNPETAAIWDLLIPALDRKDVLTLAPPGFGSPLPSGFNGTRLAYLEWLTKALEQIGEPVDLVGHDWGGGHVAVAGRSHHSSTRSRHLSCCGNSNK